MGKRVHTEIVPTFCGGRGEERGRGFGVLKCLREGGHKVAHHE